MWGARKLTLGEKVVWYHDWALDQGGGDGAYCSHAAMAARVGDSLTAGTVSKIRQRLKRLNLHHPLARRDAHNVGWVSTLPAHCRPATYRDVPVMAGALDAYLAGLAAWRDMDPGGAEDRPQGLRRVDRPVHVGQTLQSALRAAAIGGVGGASLLASSSEAELPSAVREKGAGAYAPELQEERPAIEPERSRSEVEAEGLAFIRAKHAAAKRARHR